MVWVRYWESQGISEDEQMAEACRERALEEAAGLGGEAKEESVDLDRDSDQLDPTRASHEQYLKIKKLTGGNGPPLDAIEDRDLREKVAEIRRWAEEWVELWERATAQPADPYSGAHLALG